MITANEAYELSEKKVTYYEARKSRKVKRILKKIEKKIIAEAKNNHQMLQHYLWNLNYQQISAVRDLLEEAGYETKFVERNEFPGELDNLYVYWSKDVLNKKEGE